MTNRAEGQASLRKEDAVSDAWVQPAVVKMRAGSAEVGTRTVVQDGPLAESRS